MATVQCITPINQAIYQALLDKAATYSADKQYQSNAYKKAADSIAKWNYSLYTEYLPSIPFVGPSIQNFIDEFIKSEVFPSEKNDGVAMDTARTIAAQNAPTITQAQGIVDSVFNSMENKVLNDLVNEVARQVSPELMTSILNTPISTLFNIDASDEDVMTEDMKKLHSIIDSAFDSMSGKIVENVTEEAIKIATVEEKNTPRRSNRLASKPIVDYSTMLDEEQSSDEEYTPSETDEEESDDDDDEIEAILKKYCKKNKLIYSNTLIQDYKLDSVDNDSFMDTLYDTVMDWAEYKSKNLIAQLKLRKSAKKLERYCNKMNIEYHPDLVTAYDKWVNDPANKHLTTYRKSYMTFDVPLGDAACIKTWLGLQKKVIIL